MHVLFLHQNYPAQFGQIARGLVARGHSCTFVSRHPPGTDDGVERVQYQLRGGATPHTHPFSQPIEDCMWRSHAVFEALRARPDIRPDVLVGNTGFLSTAVLKDLYPCPVVSYLDYFYRPTRAQPGYRTDLPVPTGHQLPTLVRNGLFLLDLDCCDLGYTPTAWQWKLLPREYRPKVRVIFDGLDLSMWHRRTGLPRRVGGRDVPPDTKIVTYVSRGLESARGFDVFLKAANIVCRRRTDVLFVVVGGDRGHYSPDAAFTGGKSFRQWVIDREKVDLSRFHFAGTIAPAELADLFSITDLHVYLTIPFVLSWSMLNALACGATVLASDTAPVREVVTHGETGLLTDFFDAEAMAARMGEVLDRPHEYRHLGENGAELIRREYSLEACLPKMVRLYEDAATARAERLRHDESDAA